MGIMSIFGIFLQSHKKLAGSIAFSKPRIRRALQSALIRDTSNLASATSELPLDFVFPELLSG